MKNTATGWSSPQIIIAILSLAASAGWAWVGLSRDNNGRIDDRLRAVEMKVERIAAQVEARPGAGFRE